MGLIKGLLDKLKAKAFNLGKSVKTNYYTFYNNIKEISLHKKLAVMTSKEYTELSPIVPTVMSVEFDEIKEVDETIGRWVHRLVTNLSVSKPQLIIEQNTSNNMLINIKLVFKDRNENEVVLISHYGTSLYPYIEKEEILRYLLNQNKYSTELTHAYD